MDATLTKARWTVISIPGREEDGSDTTWFAFDRLAGCTDRRRARGYPSRIEAIAAAQELNAKETRS
jgi:hypothetical protein